MMATQTSYASAPPGACVRCGEDPRREGTYLCGFCLYSKAARREVDALLATGLSERDQRLRAVRVYGWRGGWTRGL